MTFYVIPKAYDYNVQKQAAVLVMDHVPNVDEVSELAECQLDAFPCEEAFASIDMVYTAPDWLELFEQDQFNAWMRDGASCLLVIYMQEGVPEN